MSDRIVRRWRTLACAGTVVALLGAGAAPAHAAAPVAVPAATMYAVSGYAVSDVVTAANTFLGTLRPLQQRKVLLDFTEANATEWSNLPIGIASRPGIEFSALSATQLAAAKAVVQTAAGTGSTTGYAQISEILNADDVLAQSASGYGSGDYFLAFLGTPSTTGTWQLHFGGHHMALNLTYKNGVVEGISPYFVGVEPTSWTASGVTHTPLAPQHDAVLAMLSSLSATQLASAKLSQSFSDVLLGPGQDGQFPATKAGLAVSSLSSAQQALVLAAIKPWVSIAADSDASTILAAYQAQLSSTYIAYSGNSTLTAQGDYVRIDGPGVWIEFICQNGIVYQSQIHYHTVYRDHNTDYGGEFTF